MSANYALFLHAENGRLSHQKNPRWTRVFFQIVGWSGATGEPVCIYIHTLLILTSSGMGGTDIVAQAESRTYAT